MKKLLAIAVAAAALASPALAANDPAKGEKDFKKCKACHSIVSPDGEVIVKGGKTGPNLWGVVGRPAGSQEDFTRYSDAMKAVGAAGIVWTPEELAAYIPNAKKFLKENSGESSVKTAMTPQKLKDVTDVIAYLAQFGAE
ncbi:MAG: cytochrome C [Alphaproteobacteria bacterium]|nr:MAG: cytochrome C [Alphaproteobacteria bacterium]